MSRTAIAYLPLAEDLNDLESELARAGDRLSLTAVERDAGEHPRDGLGRALARLAAGDATVLIVARLRAVARSLRELVELLDWLQASGADLVALDVGLDTASSAGRRQVAALREVQRWEREPVPGHPRRGRPGLSAQDPELGRRIATLRGSGLSLQAIADALDADGVPTPRGGARWRPSSVQAALGYERPRPPILGAPHPHPRPHPGPGRGPRRPGGGGPPAEPGPPGQRP